MHLAARARVLEARQHGGRLNSEEEYKQFTLFIFQVRIGDSYDTAQQHVLRSRGQGWQRDCPRRLAQLAASHAAENSQSLVVRLADCCHQGLLQCGEFGQDTLTTYDKLARCRTRSLPGHLPTALTSPQ